MAPQARAGRNLGGTKRVLIAVVLALSLGAGAYGFADSLNVTSDPLSAGSTNLPPACSTGAHVSYASAFDPASGQEDITAVKIDNGPSNLPDVTPDPCSGYPVQIELTGSTPIYPVRLQPAVFDIHGIAYLSVDPGVPASSLTDVHVVYVGPPEPIVVNVSIDSSVADGANVPTGTKIILTANPTGGVGPYTCEWFQTVPEFAGVPGNKTASFAADSGKHTYAVTCRDFAGEKSMPATFTVVGLG